MPATGVPEVDALAVVVGFALADDDELPEGDDEEDVDVGLDGGELGFVDGGSTVLVTGGGISPPVGEPQQRGFGSKLIEGSIASELGGRARLSFAPDGLRCEIVIPREAAVLDFDRRPADEGDWTI